MIFNEFRFPIVVQCTYYVIVKCYVCIAERPMYVLVKHAML